MRFFAATCVAMAACLAFSGQAQAQSTPAPQYIKKAVFVRLHFHQSFYNRFFTGSMIDLNAHLERYFEDVRAQLLEEIQPRRELNPHYAGIAGQIDETNAVMLHIRRGDYVHSTTASSLHGVLPMAYYERALAHLYARERDFTVFVFSDDIAWARGNLPCEHPTVFIDSAQGENAVIDELMLMSRCRHQIIANSSLSWWAAWLNRDEGKVVTAPQRWLASQAIDLHDLIPSRWTVLPVD